MSFLEKLTYGDKPVRIQVTDQGQPWFCLADVGAVLGIKDPSDFARSEHCQPEGVRKFSAPSAGGDQEATFINEPNLYALIFRSSKPSAKAFRLWVFEEVLPQIRKHGSYQTHAVVQVQQPDRTRVEIPGITKPVESEKAVQPSVVAPDPSISDPLMATMQVMMALRQEQLGMNAEIQGLRHQVDQIQQGMSAASEAISALPAPTEDAPEMTTPARCRQMVDLIVGLSGRTHHQIWREAYREYELRLGVMVQKRLDGYNQGKRPKDQLTKLEWIDRHGSIQSFYSILSQMRDKLNTALAR